MCNQTIHFNSGQIPKVSIPVVAPAGLIRISHKIFCLSFFLFVAILFLGCHPAYVTVEPTYMEGMKPARPSDRHVWIDGEWAYDYPNHTYVRNAGYWSMPKRSHTYMPGRWERNEHGSRWISGHWQKTKS